MTVKDDAAPTVAYLSEDKYPVGPTCAVCGALLTDGKCLSCGTPYVQPSEESLPPLLIHTHDVELEPWDIRFVSVGDAERLYEKLRAAQAQNAELRERTHELEEAQEGWVANGLQYKYEADALRSRLAQIEAVTPATPKPAQERNKYVLKSEASSLFQSLRERVRAATIAANCGGWPLRFEGIHVDCKGFDGRPHKLFGAGMGLGDGTYLCETCQLRIAESRLAAARDKILELENGLA